MTAFKQPNQLLTKSAKLRERLALVLEKQQATSAANQKAKIVFDKLSSSELTLLDADVIVTANEVNQRHGTGVLIGKIFGGRANIFAIRAHNYYDGEQDFGDLAALISTQGLRRSEVYATVSQAFAQCTPKRVICIPFDAVEVMLAVAIRDLFNVPLCMYIMDDNNIYASGIPNALMQEALEKSALRLAISPEMQAAYQRKYNLKFWLLPPVVSSNLIAEIDHTAPQSRDLTTGILIGNIWGQRWLDLLRETVMDSRVTIHWYCNTAFKSRWLRFDPDDLAEDGIILHEPLPEAELAIKLREYAFAVVPSGVFDKTETGNNQAIARLSLPTRVPFIVASSNTPLIVLGSKQTATARFVERFQVGVISDYQPEKFQQAVAQISDPESQLFMRKNAQKIASTFSDQRIADWIFRSLEQGEPIDDRFEKLMPPLQSDVAYYIEPPPPRSIHWDFVPDYQAIRRLKEAGYYPDFVIDVGASTGIWSDAVNRLFPTARFILIEPLLSRHNPDSRRAFIDKHTNFETVEVAISNQPGKIDFQVSSDLYGSSMLQVSDGRIYETIEVEVTTLDQLAQAKRITGQGILKVDVQFAEHLVLEGATCLLKQIDAIQLELTLRKVPQQAKSFLEMLNWLTELGFEYYDECGCWRDAPEGTLIQKDVLFIRKGLFNIP
jgi:FkbM family methyltransferase